MSNILHHNVSSPPSRASTPGYVYPPSFRLPSESTLPTDDEISLSSVRLSKYSSRHHHTFPYPTDEPTPSSSPSTLPYDQLPSPTHEPASPEPPHRRIPRPPNAFMLFRSDCIARIKAQALKTQRGEKRQQVLSRVAGEAWHLLPPAQRLEWQEKAAKVFAEHQAKYPGYKFTPAPKGSARKGKHGEEDEEMSVEKIRTEILNIPGLAVKNPAPRKRASRNKAHHSVNDAKPNPVPSSSTSTPTSYPSFSSPMPMYAPAPYQDVSFAPHQMDANLPLFFPNPSMPHFLDNFGQQQQQQWRPPAAGPRIAEQRRPSTSLGFREVAPQDPIPRPASATPVYIPHMNFPPCDSTDYAAESQQYPTMTMPFDNVFSDEFMFPHLNYDYTRMGDGFGTGAEYMDAGVGN